MTTLASARRRSKAGGATVFPFSLGDARWTPNRRLRRRFGGKLREMDFGLIFRDGTILTDAAYENLLSIVQLYLKYLWDTHDPCSIVDKWMRLEHFVRFVVEHRGAKDFSQLWDVDGFIAHLKARGKLDAFGRKTGNSESIKGKALYAYLHPVKELWRFSSHMLFGIRDEPWAGKTSAAVAGVRFGPENAIQPYSVAEFAGFLRVAMSDIHSVDTLCASIESEGDWRSKLKLAGRLRTSACIIVLAMGSLRPEEMLKMPLDCLSYGFLETTDGKKPVVWLCGRIYKDRPPGGEPHRWLAADEVVQTVAAMTKLRATINKLLEIENLVPANHAAGIFETNSLLIPRLKDGVRDELTARASLIAIQDYARRPECLAFLEPGSAVTHQRFRPTLARAFSRLKLGDVRYFMAHFGHSHYHTTLGYFATFADDEFQDDVAEGIYSEMSVVVRDILSSRAPLQGARGAQLEPLRAKFAVLAFKKQSEVVSHVVRGHSLRISPHSYCLASNDTKLCPQNCLYEETNCIHCENGVVCDAHLPIWEDMHARAIALRNMFPVGSPGANACSENLETIASTVNELHPRGG
ncbi:hypothetical protein bAD24_III12005 [Burkholderia sp. AD24]|nr:hypothetical protein bAD24_III12005 [Burkholderia sp. AD24]